MSLLMERQDTGRRKQWILVSSVKASCILLSSLVLKSLEPLYNVVIIELGAW